MLGKKLFCCVIACVNDNIKKRTLQVVDDKRDMQLPIGVVHLQYIVTI